MSTFEITAWHVHIWCARFITLRVSYTNLTWHVRCESLWGRKDGWAFKWSQSLYDHRSTPPNNFQVKIAGTTQDYLKFQLQLENFRRTNCRTESVQPTCSLTFWISHWGFLLVKTYALGNEKLEMVTRTDIVVTRIGIIKGVQLQPFTFWQDSRWKWGLKAWKLERSSFIFVLIPDRTWMLSPLLVENWSPGQM